jgi:hypothetical protein
VLGLFLSWIQSVLSLLEHSAPALDATSLSGTVRGIAGAVGVAYRAPPGIRLPKTTDLAPGRVHGCGRWSDERVHRALSEVLGPLASVLQSEFEWYACRGAFFHTDAHYDGVLFGIWCLAGPPAELVFPRIGLRQPATPGHLAVFDPFEVHGVLRPGSTCYEAADYNEPSASVFVGFELALTEAVQRAFRVTAGGAARTVASHTRISAANGAFD